MAEKARTHGIDMEMTDRRDRASAPSYARTQVRPTNRRGRTEQEGTSMSAAFRYRAKRQDRATLPRTKDSLDYSRNARDEWHALARESVTTIIEQQANTQMNRFSEAGLTLFAERLSDRSTGNSSAPFQTHNTKLMQLVLEAEDMREMTWEEFQAYEKQVEIVLFRAEQIMPESERANFQEIASAARDHVDARRERMENTQRDMDVHVTSERDSNDANLQWDRAVARYGLQAVEAANEIMLQVEYSREQIDRLVAGDINADKSRLEAGLHFELARAGELSAAGNGMIREIAESDRELQFAIEAAERSRERVSRSKMDAGEAVVQLSQDPRSPDREERSEEDRFSDERQRSAEHPAAETKGNQGEQWASSSGTTRSEPAQHHIPRVEQFRQEADEAREREDRDR